jgi:hypothetical protein
MTPELEAAIQRLRAYRDQIDAADHATDRGSMDRAADLMAVYDERSWAQQLPAPKNKQWRGQPVDPESFSRFAKWAKEAVGLTPMRCYQLRAAHEITRVYLTRVSIKPQGEGPLRPLSRLVKLGYAERGIPEVWEQATADAGGTAPTAGIVRAAMAKWIDANVPKKPRSQRIAERSNADEKRRIVKCFEQVLRTGDVPAATDTVNEVMGMYAKYLTDHGMEVPSS